ncbi:MAG: DUF6452 family protein [Flavobacteriaceae bacterium]|nr:DUF6452 family protein [Flavobacteriaceae bacterium]
MHSIRFPIATTFLVCCFSLLCALFIGSCEKDDICVDGDTPLLIIRFYDQADPESTKSVNGIRVIGIGNGSTVNTFTDRSTLDSIGLPLRLDMGTSDFILIRDSEDDTGMEIGNIDTVRFTYTAGSKFVSRACGFIGQYEDLSSQLTADTDNWIQSIEISTPFVQSIDSAHVKIFH